MDSRREDGSLLSGKLGFKATFARDWPIIVERAVRQLIVFHICLFVVAKLLFDGLLVFEPPPTNEKLPQHPKAVREQLEINLAAERLRLTTPGS